ncbi:MAG: hypothetical protein U0Z53_19540 [Blastocatellia bacterium]
MTADDPVRRYLQEKGCPPGIVAGGLDGLLEQWEQIVDAVSAGYTLGLDDYLNDLDARQLLEDALAVATPAARAAVTDRVRQADAAMKSVTRPAGKCLWGDEVAEGEGWTPQKNWWYFTVPVNADPELLAEIDEI